MERYIRRTRGQPVLDCRSWRRKHQLVQSDQVRSTRDRLLVLESDLQTVEVSAFELALAPDASQEGARDSALALLRVFYFDDGSIVSACGRGGFLRRPWGFESASRQQTLESTMRSTAQGLE